MGGEHVICGDADVCMETVALTAVHYENIFCLFVKAVFDRTNRSGYMSSSFVQVFSSNAESFDVRVFLCGCCGPSINIFWLTRPVSCRCFQACERVTDP